MAANPFASLEAAMPTIIAESPSSILRVRETAADTFHAPVPYTQGPYTVRIEPAKSANQPVFDEKGTSVVSLFELVGYNLPKNVQENGSTVPLFRLDDKITDDQGNVFRVVSPQFVRGKVVQVTLALRSQ
jgi:hypothetical protein